MKNFKPFIITSLIIIVIWVTSVFSLPIFFPELSDRGMFGDSFGALNTLFSGLAFAGIIVTIIMQRKELQLQKEELKLNREEIRNSNIQLKGQKEVMKLQSFENSFYNLLGFLKEILNKENKDIIMSSHTLVKGNIEKNRNNNQRITPLLCSEQYARSYARHYKIVIDAFLAFFFETIKFIDTSEIENKNRYINLSVNILSEFESNIIFLHFLDKLNLEEVNLINKYGLLKNVHYIFDEFKDFNAYESTAFKVYLQEI